LRDRSAEVARVRHVRPIMRRARIVATVAGIVAGVIMSGAGVESVEPTPAHEHARISTRDVDLDPNTWVPASYYAVIAPSYYAS
jgi:hypothetical protein